MKNVNVAVMGIGVYLMSMQQAIAGTAAVPEIDGSGALIAIGLIAGLVALVREKFYR